MELLAEIEEAIDVAGNFGALVEIGGAFKNARTALDYTLARLAGEPPEGATIQ